MTAIDLDNLWQAREAFLTAMQALATNRHPDVVEIRELTHRLERRVRDMADGLEMALSLVK